MRTKLRSKVTLLFMTLGLLLALPAVALADRLDADADSLATGTGSSGNSLTANQQPGTTQTYPFSAAVIETGNATDNVFVNSGDKVTVNNTFGGDWLHAAGSSPASFEITAYGQNHSGVISVTVPCNANTTVGSADSKTMTVSLSATASNGKALTSANQTLSYTITASGSPAASCAPPDTQAPSVTSINRVSAEKTNTTGNLSWTATFSENVSGVDTGDFAVASSGLSGFPAVTNVTQGANASVYLVTASTGTGSGTLGLNLNDNDSIVDGANNALVGASSADGSFTGEVYTIDRTAPTVTPTALQGVAPNFTGATAYSEGDWTNKDVQVTFACEDTGGSGLTSTSGDDVQQFTANTSASGTTANFSATCADEAGNTATSDLSFGPIKIDKTAPVVTDDSTNNPPTGTAGSNGWFISAVTNTFKAADGLSGFLSPLTDPHTFGVGSGAAEGDNVSINSGTVFDVAGNESNNASSGPFKIDLTDPTVSVVLSPAAAATGWYNLATGKPTADFTCADADGDGNSANGGASGIASCTADKTFDEGENQSATGNATDVAGRSDQTPASVSDIDVDLTAPSLGNIVDNNAASSNVCTTSSAPTQPTGFSASDGGPSGINASQTGQTWNVPPASTFPYGTYSYEAHATDVAGNTNSYGPKNYTYDYGIGSGGLAYNGVLQPINMPPTTGTFTPSIFKIGSTVPVKFTLACGQTSYGDAVAKLFVKKSDSTVAGDVNEVISTSAATTGNLFRYDATAGQYIFNLSTKGGYTDANGQNVAFSAGSWIITIKFADGTTKTATFDLKK